MYGSIDTVKVRTAATAETFGFEGEGDQTAEEELDAFITTNLEQASSEIDRYCNRTFGLVEGEAETRYGNDSVTIQLENKPIVDMTRVLEGDTELVQGEDYEIKDRASFEGENNGILRRLEDGNPPRVTRWDEYHQYTFEYNWGYQNHPQVLDSIANEMVINRLNEAAAERAAEGLNSWSMDGFSVDYAVVDAANKGEITNAQLQRLDELRQPGWG